MSEVNALCRVPFFFGHIPISYMEYGKRLCIRIGHYGAIQMLYYYYYYYFAPSYSLGTQTVCVKFWRKKCEGAFFDQHLSLVRKR